MAKFTINNKTVESLKNETILEAARRAGEYIPTMCYLSKVKPIASCRMCVVEVEGVVGTVLSCNTPAIEGIAVKTNTPELFKHRQNIMKLYSVNHPLECGVCDKSGECDLQNKTLEFGVDCQDFLARDQYRPVENWGMISYDPSLCILCEKCVSVCNEITGDDALQIFKGGYNSKIERKADTDCTDCGECASVCPVGALSSNHFKYTTNAWELKQVPASCAHCSSTCELTYETKRGKIYRVTNDSEFSELCKAGRYGFDFQNVTEGKDEAEFAHTIKAFEASDTIAFHSVITNEEAQILQSLKELKGYKLINHDALAFKKFMSAFATTAGESLYNATLEDVTSSHFSIVLGSAVASANPIVKYNLNKSVKRNKAYVAYLHPIVDESLNTIVSQFIKYEPSAEENIMALLANAFLSDKSALGDLDIGNLEGEANIGGEEIELLVRKSLRAKTKTLILGSDLLSHPRSENIAKMAGLLQKSGAFKVLIIPTQTNTLGVSLICDVDETAGSKVIHYGDKAGTLDMPALNQQEGTFTNIDKKVVPTNAALKFNGYELNDIANALGLPAKHTIDYTAKLPSKKGFNGVAFDDMSAYTLPSLKVASQGVVESIAPTHEYNGTVVYACEPVGAFNPNTQKAKLTTIEPVLRGSAQFAMAAKLQGGEIVQLTIGEQSYRRVFMVDEKLKGTIAYNPTLDHGFEFRGYKFNPVKIERV